MAAANAVEGWIPAFAGMTEVRNLRLLRHMRSPCPTRGEGNRGAMLHRKKELRPFKGLALFQQGGRNRCAGMEKDVVLLDAPGGRPYIPRAFRGLVVGRSV